MKLEYHESPYSRVKIREDIRKSIINKVERFMLTPKRIAKTIGIEPRTWVRFVNGEVIETESLEKIRKYANFHLGIIRKAIEELDDVKNPRLPLNFDCPEGVRFIVGVINEGRARNHMIEYHNKDREVINVIINSAKKVIGESFEPKSHVDKRVDVVCLSFPSFVAKSFAKLGLSSNKAKVPPRVPEFIRNGPELYHKIWFRGTLSEDASLFPFIMPNGSDYHLSARIQLNRTLIVGDEVGDKLRKIANPGHKLFRNQLPSKMLEYFDSNPHTTLVDESKLLRNFGIKVSPYFTRVYMSPKKELITAAYALLINRIEDIRKWHQKIGCELYRQQEQFELLLDNTGKISKEELSKVLFNFYKLIPPYLRKKRKITGSRRLSEKQKKLLEGV